MVIIKINSYLPANIVDELITDLHAQAARHGIIVLPQCCDLLYASPGPAGKVYTIRKNGVICDSGDRPKCGYTEKELEQLREAGFDLYIGEQKAERGHCLGAVCLRWDECQGAEAETCPL